MGSPALTWILVAAAALVTVVSTARLAAADSGEARFAAGGDIVMAGGMTAMFLPATSASFGDHGPWWVAVFAAVGLVGVVLSLRHARLHGWRTGRRWAHHIIGSAAMVIMTFAMPGTDSAPVLALGGHSMAGPGHGHGHGGGHGHGSAEPAGSADPSHSSDMAGAEGTHHPPGTAAHDMPTDATAAAGASSSLWRAVVIMLAAYFLLSIVASIRARLHSTERPTGAGRGAGRSRWTRHLLALPDAIVVFVASLAVSVWDKARPGAHRQREPVVGGNRRRRRPPGTSPNAALTAHVCMGGTMCAMLVMMAA
ncbi:DUF5134 domain-containing protein [Streptomyces sp. NPDC058739]|uniref:DUF5134 domain-containing protein n=1 Tax=Streptomyces sp. NPDC058739 TaxID=3346618 RepID=UPI00369076D5